MNIEQNSIDHDDAYWIQMMGTRWSQPTLTAADVASLLDISDPADLQHDAPNLPAPEPYGHAEGWSRTTVYDHILVHRPLLQDRIPRLYPFTAALGPAQFLFGVVVEGMAVHAWQPSDGRGPVAVAYGGPGQNDGQLYSKAQTLLRQLPWATAVCCPHTSTCTADDGARQPYMAVVDRHHAVDDNYDWFEVVGLLRVDLPWWPPVLRDLEAIAAWQPGTPVQQIRARSGSAHHPDRLCDLLTTGTTAYVTGLVRRAIECLDRQAASGYIGDGNSRELPARRGLIHAAVADIDLRRQVPDITEAEAALLLSQPCPDADTAGEILQLLIWCSPIANVLPIPISSNPLAAEWINRLEPAADGCELGFWKAQLTYPIDEPVRAYRDPLNPRSWAVATADTIYAAVGRSAPATGQLTELIYEQRGGMFRDSLGQVWPLPATGYGVTGAGHYGGRAGREALVKILTNLILDASGDVSRRDVPYNPSSALAELVARTELPLVIRPGDPVLAIESLGPLNGPVDRGA